MPIATPEVYAEMLDRAKAGAFAYPAINVSSSQTLNAALRGFAEAGSDGIVQVSTGGAEYLSGSDRQEHGHRCGRARRLRARGRQELPGQHRAAHRPLPEGQAGRLRPAAAGDLHRAGRPRRGPAVPVAHVGRLGGAAGREPGDRQGPAGQDCAAAKIILEIEVGVVGGEEDGVASAIDEKLYTTVEDGLATVEALGTRREGPLHGRADLRQRARRLQAGQRQAAPGDPQGDPGRGRRQVRQGAAVRPGLPRRVRLAAGGDPGRASTTAW